MLEQITQLNVYERQGYEETLAAFRAQPYSLPHHFLAIFSGVTRGSDADSHANLAVTHSKAAVFPRQVRYFRGFYRQPHFKYSIPGSAINHNMLEDYSTAENEGDFFAAASTVFTEHVTAASKFTSDSSWRVGLNSARDIMCAISNTDGIGNHCHLGVIKSLNSSDADDLPIRSAYMWSYLQSLGILEPTQFRAHFRIHYNEEIVRQLAKVRDALGMYRPELGPAVKTGSETVTMLGKTFLLPTLEVQASLINRIMSRDKYALDSYEGLVTWPENQFHIATTFKNGALINSLWSRLSIKSISRYLSGRAPGMFGPNKEGVYDIGLPV